MIPLTLPEVARLVGGRLSGAADGKVDSVTIDSRRARPGTLFAAMVGEYLDGHDFIGDAQRRGAVAALVSRQLPKGAVPTIQLADVAEALALLAGHNRDVVDPIVVGVTGSTGKTTTREFLHSILRRRMQALASEGNQNNELGVPLTLLSAGIGVEAVVCEMGADRIGDIAAVCRYARPQVGVVTNVGVAHYGHFGSQEAVARTKSELVAALPAGGTAVLNADDPRVLAMAKSSAANVVLYGVEAQVAIRGEDVVLDDWGRPKFRVVTPHGNTGVEVAASGRHQVSNALAAVAAGRALGASLEDCALGLRSAKSPDWRMEVRRAGDVTFINDAYNSSPESLRAALETAAEMAAGGRLIAILGYMAELGEIEEAAHREAGTAAARVASRLVVVGDGARPMVAEAEAAGLGDVRFVSRAEDALAAAGELRAGDVVLAKASRMMGLERLTLELEQGLRG